MTCLGVIALVFILYHCMDMQNAKQTKRQRLVALAHGPTYVSQRGLSQTLESVRLRGNPEATRGTRFCEVVPQKQLATRRMVL